MLVWLSEDVLRCHWGILFSGRQWWGGWARWCAVLGHFQWYANRLVMTWRSVLLPVRKGSQLGVLFWNLKPWGFCRKGCHRKGEELWRCFLFSSLQKISGKPFHPWGHTRKFWTQFLHSKSSFPWFTSETKRWQDEILHSPCIPHPWIKPDTQKTRFHLALNKTFRCKPPPPMHTDNWSASNYKY